jgi:hypothetical protein
VPPLSLQQPFTSPRGRCAMLKRGAPEQGCERHARGGPRSTARGAPAGSAAPRPVRRQPTRRDAAAALTRRARAAPGGLTTTSHSAAGRCPTRACSVCALACGAPRPFPSTLPHGRLSLLRVAATSEQARGRGRCARAEGAAAQAKRRPRRRPPLRSQRRSLGSGRGRGACFLARCRSIFRRSTARRPQPQGSRTGGTRRGAGGPASGRRRRRAAAYMPGGRCRWRWSRAVPVRRTALARTPSDGTAPRARRRTRRRARRALARSRNFPAAARRRTKTGASGRYQITLEQREPYRE